MSSGVSATADPPATDPLSVVSVVPLVSAWRVDKTFDYLVPAKLAGAIERGSLVRIPFGHRNVRGVVVADSSAPRDRELEEIHALLLPHPVAPPPFDELMTWLAERYVVTRAAAFSRVVPKRVRIRVTSPSPLSTEPAPDRLLKYTGGVELVRAIEAGDAGAWSLRVLPGEDRGSIISELIAGAARSGGGGAALVTVPEVRYGSLVLDRVGRSFPQLARLETGGPEADRARAWIGLSAGWPLGGGGRATVLAPAPSLRLIIVDEEHHPTYKEDRSPRYDARRVALERARLQGAVCVLVSSTPSLETALAVKRGTFGFVGASRELSRAARPIVNTTPPSDSALTPELHHAIRDTLRSGGKVGLLVPRRGYARAVWCASCKRSLRCPRCEAGVVFDRSKRTLRCPRCGYRASPPDVCPTCGAHDFKLVGAGSERHQEQLAKTFPMARVARMDPDVLAARDDPAGAVSEPPEECDIYVTTWVGTKEALRPPVSLVGVLDADILIRRPNFRAAEAAYQALAEMSEWAGPAVAGGRLVVQCSDPGHHAVQAIVRADHDYFVERELELRSELGYPPFSELIKVTAFGPAAETLIEGSASAARGAGAIVLGPISVREPHVPEEARQVLLKCEDARAVAGELRDILVGAPKGSRLRIDVDPR